MSDDQYIEAIAKMTWQELLREILIHPEYLTECYFRDFGEALEKRGTELLEKSE